MLLFNLPLELIEHIFYAFACSRDLNRVMRLRLVNRQFKSFIDDTIFRFRLLDGVSANPLGSRTGSRPRELAWIAYCLDYLSHQAWFEKNPTSLFGRIRRAAVALSEQMGESGRDSAMARLKPLCRLALLHAWRQRHEGALFSSAPFPWPLECSDEAFEADICVAAIYLGHQPHIENLISREYRFCSWGTAENVVSGVLGPAYEAAVFKGDVSMLRLLLSSDPNYNSSEPLLSSCRREVLEKAALFGHDDAFEFALDDGPLELVRGEQENSRGFPDYDCLKRAIASTPIPDNYRRGAAMFVSNSKVFRSHSAGSLPARLADKAAHGHLAMVQYFLSEGVSPNSEEESNITKTRRWDSGHQPLLMAVKGGTPEIVRLLLDHGADPNNCLANDAALMDAARRSVVSIAQMLLDAGASPNEGCPPPIVLAVFKEDMCMFRLLREHGARLDTPETGGWAMAVAQSYELESMVDVLVQEGVGRDMVLHRCAERHEWYQPWYLYRLRGDSLERAWEDACDYL